MLHVAAFDGTVPGFFTASPVVELRLSPEGFDNLCRFIGAAYARDTAGRAIRVGAALYGWGGFYLARERYHLFDNSNQWAARALRAGGVPVTPALSLFAGTVLDQVMRVGTVVRGDAPLATAPGRYPSRGKRRKALEGRREIS